MARLLRGYPARQGSLHNAAIISPRPNLFLPKGPTVQIAVQVAINRRLSWRNSTKLSPPTVVSPKPNLFLPTAPRTNIALAQALLYRQLRRNSTKLRPPTVITPALLPAVFLPTLPKLIYAQTRAAQASLLRPRSTKLFPPTVLNPRPNLFLPTGVRSSAALGSKTHPNLLKSRSILRKPRVLNSPPPFLPTGVHTNIAVAARLNPVYLPRRSVLRKPLVVNFPPAFLPTVKVSSAARANAQTINRRFRYRAAITRLPLASATTTSNGRFFIMF